MNKTELIDRIAGNTDLSKKDVGHAVNSAISIIKQELASGGDIRIVDFGVLETSLRKARICRNPKTGEDIEVPEKTVVRFSAGKELAEMVNQNLDK